jgi:predicted PurR-regulated permease PerM
MVGVVVVAALYFSREILVPIALAVLLSFVLAPLVKLLQGWRVPRAIAVICAVTAALAGSLSLAAMVMVEVDQLADDLPRYQSTLTDKLHHLRNSVARTGLLNAPSILKNLDRQLTAETPAAEPQLSKRRSRSRSVSLIRGPRKHLSPCCRPLPPRSPRRRSSSSS